MKYCSRCGAEIHSEAVVCIKCGCSVAPTTPVKTQNTAFVGAGLGFVWTFFLGIIGFILCLTLGDDSCKKSATITFIVSTVATVVFFVVVSAIFSSVNVPYPYY